MKKMAILMTALVVTLFLLALTYPAGTAYGQVDGQEVFMAQKCNLCHTVSSADIQAKMSGKMAGPDLTGVTDRHEPELIMDYVRGDAELNGAKHKKKFTGSDEELGALIEWLSSQKAE